MRSGCASGFGPSGGDRDVGERRGEVSPRQSLRHRSPTAWRNDGGSPGALPRLGGVRDQPARRQSRVSLPCARGRTGCV